MNPRVPQVNFSKGEIGAGYRQAEATKLLEALE